jgi:hypothetical protein
MKTHSLFIKHQRGFYSAQKDGEAEKAEKNSTGSESYNNDQQMKFSPSESPSGETREVSNNKKKKNAIKKFDVKERKA